MTAIGRRVPGTAAELPLVRRHGLVRFHWRPFLFGVLLAIAAVAVAVAAFLFALVRMHDGRIVAGVSIAGVPIGGLDVPAAEARLRAVLPSVSNGQLRVVLGDEALVIPYSALGRDYRLDPVIAEAFSIGRTGEPLTALVDQLGVLMHGRDFPVTAVEYEPETLARRLRLAAAVFAQQSSNAALVRAPDHSGFSVRPSVDGRRVDAAPLIAAIGDRLGTLDPASVTLQATPIAVPPPITTEAVEAVVKKANALSAGPLELTDGEETWTIDQAVLRRWTRFSLTETGYEMSFNRKALAAFVRDLADDIDRDARDAVAVTDGVNVVGYLGARNGQALDADKSIASALAALEARVTSGTPESEPIELTVNVVRPRVANKPPPENAAVVQRLSSWTTYYVPSEKNFFGVNISLPTSRLNGTVVAPGEWFDFWSAVGPLTRANGYGPGGFIRNGRTDPTGAIAGGICSCSTTLFNAAARAGLQLGERHNHAYYITRYPLGLDATVSGSGGGAAQNMSFRNDTGSPIVIRSYNSYGATTFEIWGVPTGRRVAFSQPIVSNRVLARDTVEYTSALAPGARKRTEFPANGMRVSVTRTVYDAGGDVLHSDTFISNYVKVDGVTLVGR